jgi:hypothetical protein
MAITINDVEYEEADLDNNVKNSIVQVQNANKMIAALQGDLLNQQIIAQHHSKFISDNLPAQVEDSEEATDSDEDTTEEVEASTEDE